MYFVLVLSFALYYVERRVKSKSEHSNEIAILGSFESNCLKLFPFFITSCRLTSSNLLLQLVLDDQDITMHCTTSTPVNCPEYKDDRNKDKSSWSSSRRRSSYRSNSGRQGSGCAYRYPCVKVSIYAYIIYAYIPTICHSI